MKVKTVQITNIENDAVLASKARIADNFFTRLKGLIGKKTMSDGEALIISPCSMVHCVGMKMKIDVLFVTDSGKIIKIIAAMYPGQISPYVRKARYVVELPAGQAAQTETKEGDRIKLT
jgi:uncharacterized membrane protein (UPF0127 family)